MKPLNKAHTIKSTNLAFETAVRLLTEHMSPSHENTRKPRLFHVIRVGTYLYENNYSHDIVLAGLLHDALEWTSITETMLREQFGDTVTALVRASTKDDSIADKEEKIVELIRRCVKAGEDALIVKTADIIDSFRFYSAVDDKGELGYCMSNANAILKYKPAEFNDPIFNILKTWQNTFSKNL